MEKKSDRLAAIESLAYRLWEERGKPADSADLDWRRAEQILSDRTVPPTVLVCGIDDFAIEKNPGSGWTYFVVPLSAVPDFCERAARLLPAGMKEFRARDFKVSEAPAFEHFLRLIRGTLDQNEGSLLEVVANGTNWAKDLYESSMNVVARGFSDAGVNDQKIVAIAQKCAPPLFTVQRVLQNFGDANELRLEVSGNSMTAPTAALQMLMHLHSVSIARILAESFDTHASSLFPHSPRLNRDGSGIKILASERSCLVQASDVVGNFAAAFVLAQLGANSQVRQRKAEIFQTVFGDAHTQDGVVSFGYPAHR